MASGASLLLMRSLHWTSPHAGGDQLGKMASFAWRHTLHQTCTR